MSQPIINVLKNQIAQLEEKIRYYESRAREKRMTVKLEFPIQPIDVDLDIKQCVLEIRDEKGHEKPRITPNITWGHGGWTFQLPEDIIDTDSVRLELVEHNQRKWKVKPFPPYETDKKVIQVI